MLTTEDMDSTKHEENEEDQDQPKDETQGNHSKVNIKTCAGKEAFLRMNYLFQLSNLCTREVIGGAADAGNFYSHQMIGISKKAVQRIEPAIKRKICKTCYQFLVPGVTCKVRIRKKVVVHTCLRCQRPKRFIATPDYQLWTDSAEARVEVIDF